MVYIIDFETGGLSSYKNAVVSCCIKQVGGVKPFYIEFYPHKSVYEYSALEINKISLKTLYSQGESRTKLINYIGALYEAQNKLQSYIVLAGWNVMFDIDFLLQIYKEKGEKLPCPILALDLKEIAVKNIKKKDGRKTVDDGVENHKLVTIYQAFFSDFEEDKAHNAEYDVMMTEKLYILFLEKGWINLDLI